jgi:hypothetical protein
MLFGCYLCCSIYCLCVNVYCHWVTTKLQLIYILYITSHHITSHHITSHHITSIFIPTTAQQLKDRSYINTCYSYVFRPTLAIFREVVNKVKWLVMFAAIMLEYVCWVKYILKFCCCCTVHVAINAVLLLHHACCYNCCFIVAPCMLL